MGKKKRTTGERLARREFGTKELLWFATAKFLDALTGFGVTQEEAIGRLSIACGLNQEETDMSVEAAQVTQREKREPTTMSHLAIAVIGAGKAKFDRVRQMMADQGKNWMDSLPEGISEEDALRKTIDEIKLTNMDLLLVRNQFARCAVHEDLRSVIFALFFLKNFERLQIENEAKQKAAKGTTGQTVTPSGLIVPGGSLR